MILKPIILGLVSLDYKRCQIIILSTLLIAPGLAHNDLDLFEEYTEHVIDPCYKHGAILSGFDKVAGLEVAVAAMKAQDEAGNRIAAENLREVFSDKSQEYRLQVYQKLRGICKCQIAEKAKLINQGKTQSATSEANIEECMMQGFGLTSP